MSSMVINVCVAFLQKGPSVDVLGDSVDADFLEPLFQTINGADEVLIKVVGCSIV